MGEHPKNFLKITAVCGNLRPGFSLANPFWLVKVAIVKASIANVAQALSIVLAGTSAFGQTESPKRLSPLDEAIELYQEYSGRTVLRSPNLPNLPEFTKPVPFSDTNGMKVVLENELLKHGIEFVPLPDVFALAVESGWKNSPVATYVNTIKSRATEAPVSPSVSPASDHQNPAEEAIPAGTIDFRGADIFQVADLYGMLRNRTVLRSRYLSSPTFALRTETPLTKSGAIYLVELAMALNGIATADDGSNFVQIVPLKRLSSLQLRAPSPIASEPRIAAERVRFGGTVFQPGKPPDHLPGSANDVVSYYAELTGRIAVQSASAGRQTVLLRAQKGLTRSEVLYALETTLASEGIAIIEVDEKTIRAGYIRERNDGQNKAQ